MAEGVNDSIDIAATADEVFAVATDFEAYPEWNANIKHVEIKERDEHGRATKVWMEVDAKLKVVTYTLAYDYSKAPGSFSWRLIDGDIKELEGSYRFDDLGEVTEVVYEMNVDPGFLVPKLLKQQAARRIARGALEDLKQRVESR
jgi:ribosome-associated toxin RatA of RatAB toxin-antitoxin module